VEDLFSGPEISHAHLMFLSAPFGSCDMYLSCILLRASLQTFTDDCANPEDQPRLCGFLATVTPLPSRYNNNTC